jgi:hypothetical protein
MFVHESGPGFDVRYFALPQRSYNVLADDELFSHNAFAIVYSAKVVIYGSQQRQGLGH